MIDTLSKNIGFCFLSIVVVFIFGGAIVYHIKNYINNRKHPEHESRIVQLKTGKFQVQEWLCNWQSPEEDYICYWQEAKSFLKKATFDTLLEAKKAKEEHDKTGFEIKNRDVVARVIVGAED